MRILLGMLTLAVSGCMMRTVADRRLGWHLVQAEHVRLSTDLAEDDALALASQIESTYDTFGSVVPSCSALAPIDVVAFANGSDYDVLSHDGASAFVAVEHDALVATPAMLVVRSADDASHAPFLHALAHRALHSCHPYAAAWLQEGVPTLLETAEVAREGALRVGARPEGISLGDPREWQVQQVQGARAGTFFERDRPAPQYRGRARITSIGDPPSAYRTRRSVAWLLAYTMLFGSEARASVLAQALDGRRDLIPIAIDEANRDPTPRELAADTAVHVARDIVALAPFEADLLWASLLVRGTGPASRALQHAHLALASGDVVTQTRAQLFQIAERVLPRAETVASVLASIDRSHPDDLDTLHARAFIETNRDIIANEATRVLDEMSGRSDLRASDLVVASMLATRLERNDLALAHARAAVAMAPLDWTARITLAQNLLAASEAVRGHDELEVALSICPGAPLDADDDALFMRAFALEHDSLPRRPRPTRTTARTSPTRLSFGGAPLSVRGTVRADVDGSELGTHCRGWTSQTPIEVTLDSDPAPLVISTHAPANTTLAVVDAEGHVRCDDDSGPGDDASLLVPWAQGVLRVYVGVVGRPRGTAFELHVARAEGDWAGAPDARCGTTEYAVPRVGVRVVLRPHRAVGSSPDDVVRTNWVDAMSAYVGLPARVAAIVGPDEAGCPVVRVDADGGTWLWRVRDLGAP